MKQHCQGTCHKAVFRADVQQHTRAVRPFILNGLNTTMEVFTVSRKIQEASNGCVCTPGSKPSGTKRRLHTQNAESRIHHTTNHATGNGGMEQKLELYFNLK